MDLLKRTTDYAELYEQDETAWLEEMARLVEARRWDAIDVAHLSEYLTDMAKRDRREVVSRLQVLLTHMLKWEHQSAHRTSSWVATIRTQRYDLIDLLDSGTLRRHADEALAKAYERAVAVAVDETGLPAKTFPAECPWTVEQILAER